MPFVEFSCGCIGLKTPFQSPSNSRAVVVKPCDSKDEPIEIHRRALPESHLRHSPLATPLSDEEAEDLLNEIARLVADGYRFRQLKGLLGGLG